jgi:hypothetical protein
VGGRRRTLFLALLALAAPLPAFGISDQALEPVTAEPSPAALSVSASLDSCGVLEDGVVCKLDVSYNAIEDAASYSATVTSADGSVADYGSVPAGGTSLWIQYVGSGTYTVRVTAYGEPEQSDSGADDEKGEVIAVGESRPDGNGDPRVAPKGDDREKPEGTLEASAGGRGDLDARNADGEPASEAASAPSSSSTSTTTTTESTTTTSTTTTSTTPACEPLEPLPPEPPQDLDPNVSDEDQDGIDDQQERAEYEAAVAEHEAAAAAGCPTP